MYVQNYTLLPNSWGADEDEAESAGGVLVVQLRGSIGLHFLMVSRIVTK